MPAYCDAMANTWVVFGASNRVVGYGYSRQEAERIAREEVVIHGSASAAVPFMRLFDNVSFYPAYCAAWQEYCAHNELARHAWEAAQYAQALLVAEEEEQHRQARQQEAERQAEAERLAQEEDARRLRQAQEAARRTPLQILEEAMQAERRARAAQEAQAVKEMEESEAYSDSIRRAATQYLLAWLARHTEEKTRLQQELGSFDTWDYEEVAKTCIRQYSRDFTRTLLDNADMEEIAEAVMNT